MAAFNFPSSPTVGQTYTLNNVLWRYDGTRWINESATKLTEDQVIALTTSLAIAFS